jgi:hypothetical protein
MGRQLRRAAQAAGDSIPGSDVAIIVTDQGGTDHPRQRNTGLDSESGRGLAVVHALSSLLASSRDDRSHSVLAVISSPQGRTTGEAGSHATA